MTKNNMPKRSNGNSSNETDTIDRVSKTSSPLSSDESSQLQLSSLGNQNVANEKDNVAQRRIGRTLAGSIVRILLLDLPLLITFALYIGTKTLNTIGEQYWIPQIQLQHFTPEKAETDLTYYHRTCHANDQTAHDTSAFTLTDTTPTKDAVETMLTHGVSVIPNLLSESTATNLRDFILKENAVGRNLIYVIENDHRWSFPILVDQDPSVTAALQELLGNDRLVDLLEAVAGPDPAVIEFTAITAAYGAVGQYWHQDIVPEGSPAKYARNFLPSYSLFVPLQNVTGSMGATGICPGTHMCAAGTDSFCPQNGFQVSGQADHWPLGAGALVNQQTTHRGEAHTDPDAPHRVVFILTFAPRPRTQPQTVETRMIGHQGSYSLHWSQWGHTLSDFRNPMRHMSKVRRVLRSLGVYKARGRRWGWDYVTVCSGRISNEDSGFSAGDLEEFMLTGFWWLPKQLLGTQSAFDSNRPWVTFLQDTLKETVKACQLAHVVVGMLYAIYFLVSVLWLWERRSTGFANLTARVVGIHILVISMAWWTASQIEWSSWGRNISSSRSYTLPQSVALTPHTAGTLAVDQDILVFDAMQSEYYASYTRMLEYKHPGNVKWKERLAHYSTGYNSISRSLQQQIQTRVLCEIRQQSQRILTKNSFGSWAATSAEFGQWLSHKSLLQESNSSIGYATSQIDFLLSEVRYGYWRDSAMHQNFVSTLLSSMQDAILQKRRSRLNEPKLLGNMIPSGFSATPTFSTLRSRTPISGPRSTAKMSDRRMHFPSETTSCEPASIPFTLFEEGDVVEATFESDSFEWYRGYIMQASANRNAWDVEYDDGDVGHNLCPTCVRPYKPYATGEELEVRLEGEEYYTPCRISASHIGEDLFDMELLENGRAVQRVQGQNLRRVEYHAEYYARQKELPSVGLNDRVVALFPGAGNEWYDGFVAKVNKDGTYAIQYDDGDFESHVLRKNIDLVV